jgi:hypothetical protein
MLGGDYCIGGAGMETIFDNLEYCSLSQDYTNEIINRIGGSKVTPEVKKLCIDIVNICSQCDKNVTNFKKLGSAFLYVKMAIFKI